VPVPYSQEARNTFEQAADGGTCGVRTIEVCGAEREMAGKRPIDEEAVFSAALEVFVCRGYKEATMVELAEAMGYNAARATTPMEAKRNSSAGRSTIWPESFMTESDMHFRSLIGELPCIARPREFNEAAVLSAAIDPFRNHEFERTSTQELAK
jgi:hypothetical protein